jgi:hypothetical protein
MFGRTAVGCLGEEKWDVSGSLKTVNDPMGLY